MSMNRIDWLIVSGGAAAAALAAALAYELVESKKPVAIPSAAPTPARVSAPVSVQLPTPPGGPATTTGIMTGPVLVASQASGALAPVPVPYDPAAARAAAAKAEQTLTRVASTLQEGKPTAQTGQVAVATGFRGNIAGQFYWNGRPVTAPEYAALNAGNPPPELPPERRQPAPFVYVNPTGGRIDLSTIMPRLVSGGVATAGGMSTDPADIQAFIRQQYLLPADVAASMVATARSAVAQAAPATAVTPTPTPQPAVVTVPAAPVTAQPAAASLPPVVSVPPIAPAVISLPPQVTAPIPAPAVPIPAAAVVTVPKVPAPAPVPVVVPVTPFFTPAPPPASATTPVPGLFGPVVTAPVPQPAPAPAGGGGLRVFM